MNEPKERNDIIVLHPGGTRTKLFHPQIIQGWSYDQSEDVFALASVAGDPCTQSMLPDAKGKAINFCCVADHLMTEEDSSLLQLLSSCYPNVKDIELEDIPESLLMEATATSYSLLSNLELDSCS